MSEDNPKCNHPPHHKLYECGRIEEQIDDINQKLKALNKQRKALENKIETIEFEASKAEYETYVGMTYLETNSYGTQFMYKILSLNSTTHAFRVLQITKIKNSFTIETMDVAPKTIIQQENNELTPFSLDSFNQIIDKAMKEFRE